jgi:hypothetical protein
MGTVGVEYLRALLKSYDDGETTEMSESADVYRKVVEALVEGVKSGEPLGCFSSVCNSGPVPPNEKLMVEIEYGPFEIWVRPAP